MDSLIVKHRGLIKNVDIRFQRYLINILPWGERLIGIKGLRGVGKTTMLLQYIKQNYNITNNEALYVSLDNLYFTENTLTDFVDRFVAMGGKHLFLDEVHKYNNWAVELKNIYDYHTNLKIVFTGSSLLEILNSRVDLSRRALVYNLQGLSFREFLEFRHKIKLNSLSLEKIISNHETITLDIGDKFKPLEFFSEYLESGYFPFNSGNKVIYQKRLLEVINMILEIELPLLRKTDISIVNKIKHLLYIIAQSVPFKPNITALSNKINTTRKTVIDYINYLNDAGIFNIIRKDSFGVSGLQKPEKLFLENTNYIYAIKNDKPDIGSVRETFFLNQILSNHTVSYPEQGDFMVDGKYLFEVGGKNKTKKQISGIDNAFIVVDDVEYGYNNKIPLWLFGFIY